MLIGWAKPTPVISRNFRKIVRDENLVTLAGPASNLLLTLVAMVVLLVVCHAIPGGVTSPGGREIVIYTFQGHLLTRRQLQRSGRSCCLALRPSKSTFRSSSSICSPFRHSMAATCCATCCPTTPCRHTTVFPIGLSWILMIFVGGYILRLLLVPGARSRASCSRPRLGCSLDAKVCRYNGTSRLFEDSDQKRLQSPGTIPESIRHNARTMQFHRPARAF